MTHFPDCPDVPDRLDRAEAIPGGWIVDGPCGRPHLTGPGYDLWACHTCEAIAVVAPLLRGAAA